MIHPPELDETITSMLDTPDILDLPDDFALPDPAPARDGRGRPMVRPDPAWGLPFGVWPDGVTARGQLADGSRPYTRVSTACGWNCLSHGLDLWRTRQLLLALARRPDAAARLLGLTARDGRAIDEIAAELMVRAADDGDPSMSAAAWGTAWHQVTVPGAPGLSPVYGPPAQALAITADAFASGLERAGLEPLPDGTERFGISHRYRLAGTLDHLVRVAHSRVVPCDPGTVLVLDKKTGTLHDIDHATQLAMYARLHPYDPATGTTGACWHPEHDPDRGIIAAATIGEPDVKFFLVKTGEYLVRSAIGRYRLSLAEHVKTLFTSLALPPS